MYGVNDRRKASVAAKAPLPGEQALRRHVITQRQIRNTSITEFKSDFCNKIGPKQTSTRKFTPRPGLALPQLDGRKREH